MKKTKKNIGAVIVIGAGGLGRVVLSTLQEAGFEVKCVLDDARSLWGQSLLGVPISGPISDLRDGSKINAVAAIGDNLTRQAIVRQYPKVHWQTVIHPVAYVHPSVVLGAGTMVCAGAIIQPEAQVGDHVIINTGATVDHNCQLENYVQLSPGIHLAGNVNVGEGAFLGTGAVVIPGITIGAWSCIGAGAAVVRDIPAHITAVGVPARPLKRKR